MLWGGVVRDGVVKFGLWKNAVRCGMIECACSVVVYGFKKWFNLV